ncbi:FAD-binding oxidoreductase [Longispora sp. NPDC051575]|uniref:NAD(P)/FAD-dependent oxidoreductase n=1 Tax=Longispora sp. NPDC051575 TaxID=3154943 RepID=UPI00342A95C2
MPDFLVIGAGIAGAAAGYFLAGHGRVTVLDMESAAGYHATGRSAALFSEYFGTPPVRELTAASRAFLTAPPAGFCDTPLLHPRGALAVGAGGAAFEAEFAEGRDAPEPVRRIDPAEALARCPVLRPGTFTAAMHKPGAMDIDVAALHQGFLAGVRRAGGRVLTGARVRAVGPSGGQWRVETDLGEYGAPVVVNAAGAWADELAVAAGVKPVGLVARRRTACLVSLPPGLDARDWPLVHDVPETYYFRPESGGLLLSPADETTAPPGDARPADLDVALAAERVAQATTLVIRSIRRAWAGLRTFAPDDTPVLGAAERPGFHWLAGLGGFGIQTAVEVGRLLAAEVTGSPLPAALAAGRFR